MATRAGERVVVAIGDGVGAVVTDGNDDGGDAVDAVDAAAVDCSAVAAAAAATPTDGRS